MTKDTKHLGLRISPDLKKRIVDAAWWMKMSTQVFCVDAIERQVVRVEKKVADDGAPVRKVLPAFRKPNTGQ